MSYYSQKNLGYNAPPSQEIRDRVKATGSSKPAPVRVKTKVKTSIAPTKTQKTAAIRLHEQILKLEREAKARAYLEVQNMMSPTLQPISLFPMSPPPPPPSIMEEVAPVGMTTNTKMMIGGVGVVGLLAVLFMRGKK